MIIVKWRNMTKKITIALVLGSLLGILIIIATVPGISKNPVVDWNDLFNAFKTYLSDPSDKNAERVINFLPKTGHVKFSGSKREFEVFDFIYQNLETVGRQVYAKKKLSTRLAFRLMSISDGAFSEELDIILGRLINIDPLLFLKELKLRENEIVRYDALLGNTGEEFVDRPQDECKELRKRIDSLQSVNDKDLIQIRNRCIKELKKEIEQYCKADG
jgi:hypothetical protein